MDCRRGNKSTPAWGKAKKVVTTGLIRAQAFGQNRESNLSQAEVGW
jgi:hypothetical protein